MGFRVNLLGTLTTLGDLLYRSAAGLSRLAGNVTTTRKFLRQTGDGANSAAPAWDTLAIGDLPAAAFGKFFTAELSQSTGTALGNSGIANNMYTLRMYSLAPADGQSYNWGCPLQAGTYTVNCYFEAAGGSAKIEWYLDGVLIPAASGASIQDWYSASTVPATLKSFSMTVPTSGYHLLTAKSNGKNASSLSYYLVGGLIEIIPSAY